MTIDREPEFSIHPSLPYSNLPAPTNTTQEYEDIRDGFYQEFPNDVNSHGSEVLDVYVYAYQRFNEETEAASLLDEKIDLLDCIKLFRSKFLGANIQNCDLLIQDVFLECFLSAKGIEDPIRNNAITHFPRHYPGFQKNLALKSLPIVAKCIFIREFKGNNAAIYECFRKFEQEYDPNQWDFLYFIKTIIKDYKEKNMRSGTDFDPDSNLGKVIGIVPSYTNFLCKFPELGNIIYVVLVEKLGVNFAVAKAEALKLAISILKVASGAEEILTEKGKSEEEMLTLLVKFTKEFCRRENLYPFIYSN